MGNALKALALDEKTLLAFRPSDLRKQGVAWLLKTHTTVAGRWLASCLSMKAEVNVSRGLKRFREAEDRETKRLRKELESNSGRPRYRYVLL